MTIPPRSYAVFDIEGEEWKGKYEIKPNPFLKQREPNLWIDNFVLYNVLGKEDDVDIKEEIGTQGQETTEDNEVMILQNDVSEKKRSQKRYLYLTVFLILAINIIAIFQKVV